jgi:hypothetical protein
VNRFKPGDDVVVAFDGIDSAGVVEKVTNGWVTARIVTDCLADYGSITARMSPHSIVCVRDSDVRVAE